MKAVRILLALAALPTLVEHTASAQPWANPLADFDKLVAQLKTGNVIGEPIRAGDTAVVPFASIHFGMGAGEAMAGFGGGMSAKTVPMGVLIVEGDDVRVELLPRDERKPSVLLALLQAILDRKVVLMVNGLNIGNVSGSVQDLAPLIAEMMGQTTIITNGLNTGNLTPPRTAAPKTAPAASVGELQKLNDAKQYDEALAMANALVDQNPKSAEAHVWRGRILGGLAQRNPSDMIKYGMDAMEEFEKALALDPGNADAHLGRGLGRLAAPRGFGGDVDGAIADFEAAIARKSSAEAYYYLGEALQKKALHDRAAAAFKKALELKPDYPEAAKALAAMK